MAQHNCSAYRNQHAHGQSLAANETLATGLSQCCAEPGGNGNSALLSVVQEDRLDGGWSPVISDYDRVTNPKALREPEGCHLCLSSTCCPCGRYGKPVKMMGPQVLGVCLNSSLVGILGRRMARRRTQLTQQETA